jgi:hypothetical protein
VTKGQNGYRAFLNTVDDEIRQRQNWKFPGAGSAADPASRGHLAQRHCPFVQRAHSPQRELWLMEKQIVSDLFQFSCSLWRPAQLYLGCIMR